MSGEFLPKLSPRITEDLIEKTCEESPFPITRKEAVQILTVQHPEEGSRARGLLAKELGIGLFREKKYDEAREAFKSSIRLSLLKGATYPLPHGRPFIDGTNYLREDTFVDVVACANNVAQSYIVEKRYAMALDWLSEVLALYESRIYGLKPAFDWKEYFSPNVESYTSQFKALCRFANILRTLGNTGAAYYYSVMAASLDGGLYGAGFSDWPVNIRTLREECDTEAYRRIRHPDPASISTIRIVESELQIRGSWNKLRINAAKGRKPSPRTADAGFIWKGCLYVFGGLNPGPPTRHYNEAWSLKLRDREAGWRSIPVPSDVSRLSASKVVLSGNKAYFFHNQPTLYILDLASETWSILVTRPDNDEEWDTFFPRPREDFELAFTMQLMGNIIFVFGGNDLLNPLGRNALFALDLSTHRWRLLSGSIHINDELGLPGCRRFAVGWSVGNTMYFGLGCAGISATELKPEMDGTYELDWVYQDLWAYDVALNTWKKELWRGNGPSARTLLGCTFNASWNRAVVFGGYNPRMTFNTSDRELCYSYLADTFAWNPQTGRWSQVITRGFPTYRSQCLLTTDPETGRMYLFGGNTNARYTPTTRSKEHPAFGDVWELCIDVPGSGFKEEDFETDPKFAHLGPWRRCYQCGGVGRWMVCAGSCRTSAKPAAFCGTECQRSAGSAHKRLDGCKNLK